MSSRPPWAVWKDPVSKKMAGQAAKLVESLPSGHEALGWNPSTA